MGNIEISPQFIAITTPITNTLNENMNSFNQSLEWMVIIFIASEAKRRRRWHLRERKRANAQVT